MLSVKKLESLIVELTNSCNLKCSICPAHGETPGMNRAKGFMSIGLFKNILDSAPGLNRLSLNNWGESLLHPDLFEMITYAKNKGAKNIILCTNGTMLNRSISQSILETNLDTLEFSIDGLKERSENIRKTDYSTLIDSIDEFLEIRKNNNFHCEVGIVMVAGDAQPDYIAKFKELWRRKVDYIKIQPKLKRGKRANPCMELWGGATGRLVILWDGKAVPCCVDYQGALDVGDASKENVFDIWNGEKMKRLRKAHTQRRLPDPCRNCDEIIDAKFTGSSIFRSEPIQ